VIVLAVVFWLDNAENGIKEWKIQMRKSWIFVKSNFYWKIYVMLLNYSLQSFG
jgi:hypothetical protein